MQSELNHVNINTGRTTNNKRVKVPWGQITNSPDKYIDAKFRPTTVIIREPWRMQVLDLRLLLAFWQTRQKAGQPVLRFAYVNPGDSLQAPAAKAKAKKLPGKEKKRAVSPSPSTSSSSSNDAEPSNNGER